MAYDEISGLLDSSWGNTEDDEWEIIQYLRQGGILYGDRIGEETPQDLTDPRHILVSRAYDEPEKIPQPYKPKLNLPHPWEPEFIGPPRPPRYDIKRCIQCNRSMPWYETRETCSEQCQQTIDSYREYVLTWMGIK